MKVLIIFATYSGGTEAAVQVLEKSLTQHGLTVSISNPKGSTNDMILQSDLTIFCSPSWDTNGKDGQPHEEYFPFMESLKNSQWDTHQFAVMGLGDSSYPHFCGAVSVLETFIQEHKGKIKIPSLRLDGYFYNESGNAKIIQDWANQLV
jgi:flavodoxin I